MARPRGRPPKTSSSSATPVKRVASPGTPLRQSKRTKSTSTTPATQKVTPKKSVYFEPDSEPPETETEPDDDDEASGYEEPNSDDDSAISSPPESEISDEYNSESDQPRSRRKKIVVSRGKTSKVVALTPKPSKGQELWKEGVKVDAEVGQEVFIKLPKARGPGNTPYKDSTLHPNTFLFLADLKQHNERAWLKVHDADYRQAQKDFSSFVECLTEKLIEVDDTIPELPAKDIVFRIYRDVRFSNDPSKSPLLILSYLPLSIHPRTPFAPLPPKLNTPFRQPPTKHASPPHGREQGARGHTHITTPTSSPEARISWEVASGCRRRTRCIRYGWR